MRGESRDVGRIRLEGPAGSSSEDIRIGEGGMTGVGSKESLKSSSSLHDEGVADFRNGEGGRTGEGTGESSVRKVACVKGALIVSSSAPLHGEGVADPLMSSNRSGELSISSSVRLGFDEFVVE